MVLGGKMNLIIDTGEMKFNLIMFIFCLLNECTVLIIGKFKYKISDVSSLNDMKDEKG